MKQRPWFLTAALVLLNIPVSYAAGPVMKLAAKGGLPSAQLLGNGNFEEAADDAKPVAWTAAANGFVYERAGGRAGSGGLRAANATANSWSGASQTVVLNRTNASPIIVRGWSKAEQVSGSPDSGYSLYVDLLYADGSPLWGQTANFRCGTHDWQPKQVLIFPDKPVKSLTLHCILRGHSGTAWFDDVTVEELGSDSGAAIFDGVPVARANESSSKGPEQSSWLSGAYKTRDGLDLRLQGGRVKSLRAGKRQLVGDAPSGFLARDVAADSDFYSFTGGNCAELGVQLRTDVRAQADHVRVDGRITDLRGKDRAISLYFALPFKGNDWSWGQDIRRHERMKGGGSEYSKLVAVGCGANGAMSLYPFGAIWTADAGVGLGLNMDQPAQFRLACNRGTGQFFIAFDFGLVPETARFPSSADFSFVVFTFEPQWGFRAAFEKYARIFPEHFKVRSPYQGIWMPFTDVSTVKGWEDFGFKYHEGINNVPWDDEHAVLSFRYTEPMTWWMRMPKEVPRTMEEALKSREKLAAGRDSQQASMARVADLAGMWDESNQPSLSFRDTPWCDGAVWSLNPNPWLPAATPDGDLAGAGTSGTEPVNGATIYWNETVKAKLYGPGAKGKQDGEYLDSLEGYVTTDLNFRREHFRATSVPLTFSADTRSPALFKGLAVYEFTRWLASDVHGMGKLMFANGVPYRLSFLCPWLDVMGTETDWLHEGKYRPSSDEQMCLWRTMSGQKPYLLLLNTDYATFTPDLVEKYFQRSLFYGMFPSMFSHNAADNPYWQNPRWYNRDRHLFKKYIPLVRKLSAAGWEPVTRATCTNPRLYVERFGSGRGNANAIYFTVFNDSDTPQSGQLRIEADKLGVKSGAVANELISGNVFGPTNSWNVKLDPQQVALVELRRFP